MLQLFTLYIILVQKYLHKSSVYGEIDLHKTRK